MNNRIISVNKSCKLNQQSINSNNTPDFIYYLDTGNITQNKIDNLQYLQIIDSEYPSRAKRKVKNNTIIYSTVRPNQEHFGILKNPDSNLIVSTGFTTIDVIDKDLYPLYLYYSLTRKEITGYLQLIAENSVSSYPSINSDDIGKLSLKVPVNIQDQRKIAAVLSALDAKIELNNRINAQLESLAKTIYDYWFVQFDFPFDFAQGKPSANGKPYKSSGGKMVYVKEGNSDRAIPAGWELKRLSYFCNKIGDGIHGTPEYVDGSSYHFINGNNLKNGFIEISHDTKNVSSDEYQKYFTELNEETILLSINGTLGNLALYTGEKVMLGKSAAYINCKNKYRPYCYQFLKLEHIQKKLWNISTGSTIKNLSLESIKNILVLFPSANLIEQYYELTEPLDNKRKNIFRENQQLTQLRDWLLPMLMNGQVSIK